MAGTSERGLLIVDDDERYLERAEREFSGLGWSVTPVASVAEAMLAADTRSFDAMLVDFQLPDGDGLTLIELLQDRLKLPSASILLSWHLDVPTTVRAMRAGVFDVLEQPASAREVDGKLQAALSKPRRADEPARAAWSPRPLRELERDLIEQAWEASGRNLSAAARQLGLPRTTMRDRLRRYGLR